MGTLVSCLGLQKTYSHIDELFPVCDANRADRLENSVTYGINEFFGTYKRSSKHSRACQQGGVQCRLCDVHPKTCVRFDSG